MNRWKLAFFILLLLWLSSTALLLFAVVDQGVSLTYQREGYADCEAHRDFLSSLARGRLNRAQLKAAPPVIRSVEGFEHPIGPADLEFRFDDQGRYLGSTLGASSTP